jgi:hypothetical protein
MDFSYRKPVVDYCHKRHKRPLFDQLRIRQISSQCHSLHPEQIIHLAIVEAECEFVQVALQVF